jgi:hypothetical protein
MSFMLAYWFTVVSLPLIIVSLFLNSYGVLSLLPTTVIMLTGLSAVGVFVFIGAVLWRVFIRV